MARDGILYFKVMGLGIMWRRGMVFNLVVMVNLHCHRHWLQDHLGHTSPGKFVRTVPEEFN